ncbi:hypothetical protein D3C78_1612240 [compost metagenome]
MADYNFYLREILSILDPASSRNSIAAVRKPRLIKYYKNPSAGELIETNGGNHKVLKAWKAEHGSATVASWIQ